MQLLVTVCVFACLGMKPNEALPFSFRGSHTPGDTFILMPGVHLRRTFKVSSVDSEQTTTSSPPPPPPPVVFGHTFNDAVPISFGNPSEVLPPQETEREELIPVFPSAAKETTSEEPGSEGPTNLLILGQAPSEAPTPLPDSSNVTEDEGSGDSKVFFPTKIRVDLTNRDAGAEEDHVHECGLAHGSVEVNGTCTRFLARNGCPDDEWYVMSDDSASAGECVPRPCPMGQLFYRGRCVGASDPSVCSEGQMLYVDFNGHVACDCMPNFIYDPWSGKCYAQGDQGNCDFGFYMYVEDGFVECKKNPCLVDGFVYYNLTGKCYKKMYTGFCDDGLLIAYESNRTAECQAIVLHSIFDLPTVRACPSGSVRDYIGNCREAFRAPSSSSYPQIFGGCPYGFKKDPRGTCRKTHSLFG